jgi:hypothetical protein
MTNPDIKKLRQLVNLRSPEPAAHWGDAWISSNSDLSALALGINHHGTELMNTKKLSPAANPFLPEEHRTPRIKLNRESDQKKQRRQ